MATNGQYNDVNVFTSSYVLLASAANEANFYPIGVFGVYFFILKCEFLQPNHDSGK